MITGRARDRVNPDEREISHPAFGGHQSSIQLRLTEAWCNRYRKPVMKPRSENRGIAPRRVEEATHGDHLGRRAHLPKE
jgi:hypothetical protein